MSRRDDKTVLLGILNAAKRITGFIEGMDSGAFRRDKKTQAAVQATHD